MSFSQLKGCTQCSPSTDLPVGSEEHFSWESTFLGGARRQREPLQPLISSIYTDWSDWSDTTWQCRAASPLETRPWLGWPCDDTEVSSSSQEAPGHSPQSELSPTQLSDIQLVFSMIGSVVQLSSGCTGEVTIMINCQDISGQANSEQ